MTKKKYVVVAWDWREEAPISDIADNSKFYKHYYQHYIDDTNYVIFSDTRIKSDEEAEEILAMDYEELEDL